MPPWRIWWRMAHGDHVVYVSLSPGETRTTRPDGEFDIVREIPPHEDPHPLTRRCRAILEAAGASPAPGTERLLGWAREVLECTDPEKADAFEAAFQRRANELITSPDGTIESLAEEMYGDWFYRMGAGVFAETVLSMNLSRLVRVAEPRPIRATRGELVEACIRTHPEHRAAIAAAAVQIGNAHFQGGEQALREALDSTGPRRFFRLLHRANHDFITALLVAASETVAATGGLEYRASIAEEGSVVCVTGIASGMDGFLDGGNLFDDEERVDLLLARGREGFRAYMRSLSMPQSPIMPRLWSEIEMGRAMVKSGTWAREGLDVLEKAFELLNPFKAVDSADAFEAKDRIYVGMIRGHQALGDEDGARRWAARRMGEMLAHSVLSRMPDPT
ncbi:MAG: hypothetical protein ACJ8GN_27505 [Longimicrobiaceae bacterium]